MGATPASASSDAVVESSCGHPDDREREPPPVHRLEIRARLRPRHVQLENQLVGLDRRHVPIVVCREPVEVGNRQLAARRAHGGAEREQRRRDV